MTETKAREIYEVSEKFLQEEVWDKIQENNRKVINKIEEHHKRFLNLKSFEEFQKELTKPKDFKKLYGEGSYFERLFDSLINRTMLPNIFKKGENYEKKNSRKNISDVLFEYDGLKILKEHKTSEKLFKEFQKELKFDNEKNKLAKEVCQGIIDGCNFFKRFEDGKEFKRFLEQITSKKEIMLALPLYLSKEIKGFGFALSCDFLKECGFKDYLKPDTHIIDIFKKIHGVKNMSQWECYKKFIEFLDCLNEKEDKKSAYEIDKILWLNCKVNKEEFLKKIKPLN